MGPRPPADEALDHDLMAAVAQGDASAFARLVRRHLGWSLGFAERMLGTRHDAEDLVQVAFLRVWQEAARWEPRAKFSTWLYRVLHNLCMDRFRALGVRPDLDHEALDEDVPDEAPGSEARLQGLQRDERVRAALAALPERQRTAIVLCYYEERSQAEAASLLGVSEGALESLLSRARAGLRQWLKNEMH